MKKKLFAVLVTFLVLISACIPAFADSQLTEDTGAIAYDNYIVIKNARISPFADSYVSGYGLYTDETYTVIANYAHSGTYTAYGGFTCAYYGNFETVEECKDALQNGTLLTNGNRAIYKDSTSHYNATSGNISSAASYTASNYVYLSEDFTYNGTVFHQSPLSIRVDKVAIVGGLTVAKLTTEMNPLSEIIAILPLILVVVVSFLGLRKGLNLLLTVLRGA